MNLVASHRLILVGFFILFGESGHCAQDLAVRFDGVNSDFALRTQACERIYERSRFSDTDLFGWEQGQNMDAVSFYPGLWYLPAGDTKFVSNGQMDSGSIVVRQGQTWSSVDRKFRSGAFPKISGKDSFAVEVCYRVTAWSKDFWPAIWMLPIEHNHARQAHWPNDPERFERWLEIDIDEGGFGLGMAGTAHNWAGDWPKIYAFHNENNISPVALDRTRNQCFGVYYDVSRLSVDWFLNGARSHGTGDDFIHPVARLQNFFLIFSNQQHQAIALGYKMIISKVAAYKC